MVVGFAGDGDKLVGDPAAGLTRTSSKSAIDEITIDER
jgi:hypothetical protein